MTETTKWYKKVSEILVVVSGFTQTIKHYKKIVVVSGFKQTIKYYKKIVSVRIQTLKY